jgi:hypothetical protein
MDSALQELLDKKACEEVLLRYGRTLDWMDYPGQGSCFWPDAEIDYGFLKSDSAGWLNKLKDIESTAVRRWHLTASSLIQVDGDHAFAESYTLSVGTTEEEGQLVNTLFGGRLMDDFEKRSDEWRIRKRLYVCDWSCQAPDQNHALITEENPLNTLGVSGPGHPSYRPM